MPLKIPRSAATSTVRIIDSTTTIHYPSKHFFDEPVPGHDDLACPAYSFLVSDSTNTRHVLFDLGVRTDWRASFPPHFLARLDEAGASIQVEKDVADILKDHPRLPQPSDIETIVWSHHHFDHTGNPSLFPPHVSITVGPGFKSAVLPGYPADAASTTTADMWQGRELIELDFASKEHAVEIHSLRGYDYFGDGSFYLVYTPGHAPGHISGLARVTPDTFVLMGGDAAHHAGEIRPTTAQPLPDHAVLPSSSRWAAMPGCPCEVLERVHPRGSRQEPFYRPSDHFCLDRAQALDSIAALCDLDADDAVFVVLAHDRPLRGRIPLYPSSINDWRREDLDAKTRWAFLDDFAAAVDEVSKDS
ncbi:unnamed protein product [Parajaminaea phylloscopi]